MFFVHKNVSFPNPKHIFFPETQIHDKLTHWYAPNYTLIFKMYDVFSSLKELQLLFNTIEIINCKLKHTLKPDGLLQNVHLPSITS